MLCFINKLVFSEVRMTKWVVWCSEVTACLGIRNNWIPSSALLWTLSQAFILTFSRGNIYQIDFLFVSRICGETFWSFCLQSGDICDSGFQRILKARSCSAPSGAELWRQAGRMWQRVVNNWYKAVLLAVNVRQAVFVFDVVALVS